MFRARIVIVALIASLLWTFALTNHFAAISSPDKAAPAAKAVEIKPTEQARLDGYYTVKGQEAGSKAYTGVATIQSKGSVHLVQWVIGAGSAFSGIGIRDGDTLAVSWALPPNRDGLVVRGINLYKISGKTLSGTWTTLPGPGVQSQETMTWLKAIDREEE